MNALGHVLVALLVCAIAAALLGMQTALEPIVLSVVVLGALAPDVDHRRTKLFKLVMAVVFVASLVLFASVFQTLFEAQQPLNWLYALGAAAAVTVLVCLLKPRHRGITHSFLALAAFAAVVYALTRSTDYALLGGLAYFTHLAGDKEFKLT